jgi:6-phosphogluconolactonase (cycloisomerase 2 family)
MSNGPRVLPVLAIAIAAALIAAGLAIASGAKLTYRNCITGELESDSACTAIPSATSGGSGSGLNAVESVTVSRDGRWVYAMARQDDSIARFKRARRTGRLTYRDCLTGDIQSDSGACTEIPTASSGGAGSGLDDVRALVISRDGLNAYAVVAGQDDDAVARFSRDPLNGELTFQDCIAGATFSGPGPVGTDACTLLPSASDMGTNSGLDHPKSLTLSRDGKSLYVASTLDAAVARFSVDPTSGELTYRDCITGETQSGPVAGGGSGACAATPHATSGGLSSGLADVRGLVVSRDDRWLYGVADDDDAVVRFARAHSGKLTFTGCLSGDTNTGPSGSGACRLIGSAAGGGANSGLDDIRSFALSRDGKTAYVASRGDAAISRLHRAVGSGRLTFTDCISGDLDTGGAGSGACRTIANANTDTFGRGSGLGGPESIVLGRDGKGLYVSIAQDAGVARFKRAPRGGRLTYQGCVTGHTGLPCREIPSATATGGDSGLDLPQFMALSPDGRSLYAGISQDDAVARFSTR